MSALLTPAFIKWPYDRRQKLSLTWFIHVLARVVTKFWILVLLSADLGRSRCCSWLVVKWIFPLSEGHYFCHCHGTIRGRERERGVQLETNVPQQGMEPWMHGCCSDVVCDTQPADAHWSLKVTGNYSQLSVVRKVLDRNKLNSWFLITHTRLPSVSVKGLYHTVTTKCFSDLSER